MFQIVTTTTTTTTTTICGKNVLLMYDPEVKFVEHNLKVLTVVVFAIIDLRAVFHT
jgi:hypothetical protein